jgi:chromate transport protein ChrA
MKIKKTLFTKIIGKIIKIKVFVRALIVAVVVVVVKDVALVWKKNIKRRKKVSLMKYQLIK